MAFWRCRRGNFALVTALLLPMLMGMVGGAMDFYMFSHHRAELQSIADGAVLAAATEAGLKGWSAESAKQVAGSFIEGNLSARYATIYTHDITVDVATRRVELEITQDHYGYFLLGYFTGSPQIRVTAASRATGQATLCIIAQATSQADAIALSGKSRIFATGCSAYSNSTNSKGLTVKDTSLLKTQLACSAGGYSGKGSNFAPLPITDCPTIIDPLAARAALVEAAVGSACSFNKLKLKSETRTLSPGVYCGGIEVRDGSQISLQPGIYVIKDGKLKLDQGGSISGDGVGFVFIGNGATAEFKNNSAISLSAPDDGPMAGILIYAKPTGKAARDFKIESKDAQKLIGTVYLPADALVVGGDKNGDGICDPYLADDGTLVTPGAGEQCDSDVGTSSAWTAIVASRVRVTAGSTLVLNSDYENSDIPVPDGIGPNSSKIMLSN